MNRNVSRLQTINLLDFETFIYLNGIDDLSIFNLKWFDKDIHDVVEKEIYKKLANQQPENEFRYSIIRLNWKRLNQI